MFAGGYSNMLLVLREARTNSDLLAKRASPLIWKMLSLQESLLGEFPDEAPEKRNKQTSRLDSTRLILFA